MAQSDLSRNWDVIARWSIRVLAVIEAIDALVFMNIAGPDSDPVLIFLTVLGMLGLVLVWLAMRLPGKEWVWLSVGALMVAAAPAIFYPASGVLFILGIAVLIVGAVRLRTPAAA